ncbi:hypothetical protein SAMN05421810_109199 [Amycolatopsis arida]|uniref:PknH-like extracellular domain-containing protein n=1 Tax=Amycolatopsis arida TaxID=587909 RepID=A0A1I5ZI31_9PSEU|nr:hypothetical protein [Amycolatopsis arida]TDX89677.1 hypothetical protein CLV69_109198 [Amycolatopsis arida]SFQ55797.1 hypothetical protein SAMN05421810_109199 [Amycolatopsis arida]
MRHGAAIAVVVLVGLGVAGCSDRPNDLNTYYDDPAPAAEPETAARSGPVTASPPPPTPSAAPVRPAVDAAVLTDADVAAEGVRPSTRVERAECFASLTAPPGAQVREAGWEYPTNSALTQLVIGYPDRPAAEVVTAATCAGGEPLALPAPPGADAHRAWCVGPRCTVLLARDHVVSTVTVAAGSTGRASAAVTRLVPVATTALGRAPDQP